MPIVPLGAAKPVPTYIRSSVGKPPGLPPLPEPRYNCPRFQPIRVEFLGGRLRWKELDEPVWKKVEEGDDAEYFEATEEFFDISMALSQENQQLSQDERLVGTHQPEQLWTSR